MHSDLKMSVNILALFFLYMINFKISSCANPLRPNTELYDAFNRLLKFSPTLLGYNYTAQDKALFAAARKNQDVQLSVEKIISNYGYQVEQYNVTTEDGYILNLLRIRGTGSPVLLMHGLMLSADDWATPGPESGLPYLLAAEGYDVWMGNARGTKNSLRHISLSAELPEFWNFSWDEIGRYDLPAMIDYVLHSTNHRRLLYVGHSQGNSVFLVMASERPEYQDKIAFMVALAPSSGTFNIKSPILLTLNYLALLRGYEAFAIARQYGLHALSVNDPILQPVSMAICGRSEIAKALCSNIAFLMTGFSYNQLNFSKLPVILSHLTSEVAVKQVEHFAQTLKFQRFQRFDYGSKRNKVLYGSEIPPEYKVGSITTPMLYFYSSGDWMISEVDVKKLSKKLQNVTLYRVPDHNFSHLDFVIGKDLRKLIFTPMMQIIKGIFI